MEAVYDVREELSYRDDHVSKNEKNRTVPIRKSTDSQIQVVEE